MKRSELFRLIAMICCMALPLISLAQPAVTDPNDTPIDGGLTLLLAAGAAYGVKKYRAGKKKGQEPGLEEEVKI